MKKPFKSTNLKNILNQQSKF